ncbi:hypothetical protein MMC15_005247 [Xylographa vitiligo]|nr:hypothetical protein [Xylographa vitiligo]
MWPPKPLVPHKTALLFTSIYKNVLAFVFATLALIAGWRAPVLENSAILTFDTTNVSSAVIAYLDALPVNASAPSLITGNGSGGVRQWYSAHYLSVCKGDWATIASGARPGGSKNLSTAVCEPQAGGYVFALADELARDATPAAAGLFAGWEFGVLRTMGSVVLLAGGLGFVGLTLVAVLHTRRYAVPVANMGFAAVRGVGDGKLEGGIVVVTAARSRGFAAFGRAGAVLMVLVVPVNVGMWMLVKKGAKSSKRSSRWGKANDVELLPS